MGVTQAIIRRWSSETGYRNLLKVALPLILSAGIFTILQLLNRIFLSWYSESSIAAASPASSLNWSISCILIGITSYTGTFIAQLYGSRAFGKIGPMLWQGIYLSFIGVALGFLLNPFAGTFFGAFDHPPELLKEEVEYFRILNWCIFPLALNAALSSFFSGIGHTWPVLWANILSMTVNVTLDYVLIFGKFGFPEMGIRGAGFATLAAEISICVLLVFLVFTRKNRQTYALTPWSATSGKMMGDLFKYGFPNGAHSFLEVCGVSIFSLCLGSLGSVSLAASNITFQIDLLGLLPLQGMGAAITILVGQHLGAGRPSMARQVTFTGIQASLVYITLMAGLYVFWPDLFIRPFIYSSDPIFASEVRFKVGQLLGFVAVYTFFDLFQICFSSTIKGAGDTRYVMWTLVLSSMFILVLPAFIMTRFMSPTLTQMWTLMLLFVVSLAISFAFRFFQGKWMALKITEGI